MCSGCIQESRHVHTVLSDIGYGDPSLTMEQRATSEVHRHSASLSSTEYMKMYLLRAVESPLGSNSRFPETLRYLASREFPFPVQRLDVGRIQWLVFMNLASSDHA
jgi:hypothetical protein